MVHEPLQTANFRQQAENYLTFFLQPKSQLNTESTDLQNEFICFNDYTLREETHT